MGGTESMFAWVLLADAEDAESVRELVSQLEAGFDRLFEPLWRRLEPPPTG
jgi:hypothetical protein